MHLLGYKYNSLSFSVDQSHAKPMEQNTNENWNAKADNRKTVGTWREREGDMKMCRDNKTASTGMIAVVAVIFCFGMVVEYVCSVCVCVCVCVRACVRACVRVYACTCALIFVHTYLCVCVCVCVCVYVSSVCVCVCVCVC